MSYILIPFCSATTLFHTILENVRFILFKGIKYTHRKLNKCVRQNEAGENHKLINIYARDRFNKITFKGVSPKC